MGKSFKRDNFDDDVDFESQKNEFRNRKQKRVNTRNLERVEDNDNEPFAFTNRQNHRHLY